MCSLDPSPVRDLKATAQSSTSISVKWKKPAQPNGRIDKYQVYLKEIERRPTRFANEITAVGGNTSSLVLDELKPFTIYEMKVTAVNINLNNEALESFGRTITSETFEDGKQQRAS